MRRELNRRLVFRNRCRLVFRRRCSILEGMIPPTDPHAFRDTLGRFASGVTVVTTVVSGEVHGMTANAFVSVSLNPPLILVSVDNRAKMFDLLGESGRYGVSILSKEQEVFSNHFAGWVQEVEPEFTWQLETPLLKGAVAHIVADVKDVHPAGDHTLFVGEVQHLDAFDGEPLLYFTGKYGRLSLPTIHPKEAADDG